MNADWMEALDVKYNFNLSGKKIFNWSININNIYEVSKYEQVTLHINQFAFTNVIKGKFKRIAFSFDYGYNFSYFNNEKYNLHLLNFMVGYLIFNSKGSIYLSGNNILNLMSKEILSGGIYNNYLETRSYKTQQGFILVGFKYAR